MSKNASTHLPATTRNDFGKGAARRTRREGKVPAVLYGPGREPVHIALPEHDLVMALRQHGRTALLQLTIDGGTDEQLALTRAIQTDPIRRIIEHVDFLAVVKGEHTTSEVALTVVGEVERDSVLENYHSTLLVEAAVEDFPDHLDVDVSSIAKGGQLTAGDVVLPKGVLLAMDPETIIISVGAGQVETESTADEAPAEPGVVGDEDADAEGGDAA